MKKVLWLLILLCAGIQASFATHILGGELTYKYLGSNGPADRPFRYQVRFVGYVDRVGTPGQISNWGCGNLGFNPAINIYNAGTNARINRNAQSTGWPLPSHGPNIPGQCPINPYYGGVRPLVVPVPQGCNVPGLSELNVAITDTTFEVQLPLSTSGYYVKYENCCRTNNSTNIDFGTPSPNDDPGNTWLAFIPSPIFVNSSPQFIGDAVPFFCLGDTATISNNAFDPDGDRLIYSFATPYSDGQGNDPVFSAPGNANYKAGYSQSAPFGPNGFASINPSTGLTRYYSPTEGLFAVAIDIQEYRTLSNGTEILLSTTRREFLVVVKTCAPNPPPNPQPPFGSAGFTLVKSEGDSVVFQLKSFDLDSNSIIAESELFNPGNGTGSLAVCPAANGSGGDTIRTTFRWKIDCGVTKGIVRNYSVTVAYQDYGCPPKTFREVYTIVVNPFKAPVITGRDSVCSTFATSAYTVPAGTGRQWKMIGGNIVGSSTGSTVNINFPGDTARLRLVVTSGLGCKDSTSKKLTKVPFIPIFATAPSAWVCQDSTITLNASGGFSSVSWAPTTGLTLPNTRNPKAKPNDTTDYIVTSNGPGGCVAKDTVQLKWVPRIAAAGPDSILCSGLQRIIGANQPSGYKNYSYLWSPATGLASDTSFRTNATLSNSGGSNQTATFVQTARHRASNCISTDTVRLVVKPLPVVNAGPDTAVICSGLSTLIGTPESVSAIYQWSPSTGLSSPTSDTTQVSLNPDSVQVQFYQYFLTKTEGIVLPGEPACTNRDSILVRVNPLPFFELAAKDSICSGLATTIGTLNQAGFSYAWSPTRGLSTPTGSQTSISLTNLSQTPGDTLYTLLVTNGTTACERSKQINIRVNPLPLVSAGSDTTLCSGDSLRIGELAENGFSYAWNPGSGLSTTSNSPTRVSRTNPIVGGPAVFFGYRLTKINNRTSCQNSDSMTVKVKALPVVNAGPDTAVICSGLSTLIGTPESVSAIYQWSPSTGLSSPTSDTTQVSLNPDSVQVQFYQYFLTKTEGIVLPGEPACTNRDSILVRVNPLPFFELAAKDSICSGLATTIGTLNQAGFSYAWSPTRGLSTPTGSQTSISLTNLSQTPGDTLYTLLVTNGTTACERSKQINIRVNPLPIVNAGLDTAFCSGDSLRIGENPVNGFSYSWTPSAGIGSPTKGNPNVSLINPVPAGPNLSFTYKLTKINNTTTCRNADSLVVQVKALPIVNAAATDTLVVCSKVNLQLGETGRPSHTYLWSPDSALSASGISDPVLNINNPGQTVRIVKYRVLATNTITTCKNTDSVSVKINPLPIVPLTYSDTAVCTRDTIRVGGAPVAGYTYTWSPKNPLLDSTLSSTLFTTVNNSDAPVSYTFNLNVKINATTCENNKSLVVRVNPLPDADAGPDKVVCSRSSIQIGTPPVNGRKYLWSPVTGLSNPNISNPTVSLVNNGSTDLQFTYTLQVTDTLLSTRCDSSDAMVLTVRSLPEAVAAAADSVQVCAENNLALGIVPNPALNYAWSPALNLSNTGVSNPVFNSGTASGSAYLLYVLTVQNPVTTCQKSDSVHILVNSLPVVNMGNLDSLCSGDTIQLGPGSGIVGATFAWSPAGINGGLSYNQLITASNPGNAVINLPYKLVVTLTGTGCRDSASLNVRVNPLPQVNAGVDRSICSADFTQLGVAPQAGFGYNWAANPGLTFTNISNPQFSGISSAPKNDTLKLTMTNLTTQCRRNDSVVVTTNPRPLPLNFVPFSNVVCPFTPNVSYAVLNSPAGNTYNWTVSGGTQVSGGNGPAITVNWNGPNLNAKIVVLPTNEFGCTGKKDSIQLLINQNLKPTKPFGDSVICSYFRAQKLYSTVPTPGSTYTWNSVGTLTPSQTSPTGNVTVDWTITDGTGLIWIEQQSSTVDPITATPTQCFGRSDTLKVVINRSPDSTLTMSGDVSVCSGAGTVRPYSLAGLPNSAYNWTISPSAGIVSGQGTGNITVLWADTGNFIVSVVETTDKGCVGKAIAKNVVGNPVPRPGLSGLSDLRICPNDLSKPYFAQSAPGFSNSVYNWTISGGTAATPVNEQFLAVNWDNSGVYALSLRETTPAGCFKDTLIPLLYDPSQPVLSHVSLFENDESQVLLKFSMKDGALNQSAFSIQRKELGSADNSWQTIQNNLALNITQATDQPGNTAGKAYEYRVISKNRCDKGIQSQVLNTILLKAEALPDRDGLNLKWNPFVNWPGGTAGYSILRKVDEESSLRFFDDAPQSSAPERFFEVAGDGFEQCWRVVANQSNGNEKSFSNTVCVKFENPLVFYNFISPNGDGRNDKWEIKNLKLYPKNKLKIIDRWGQVVFEKDDYSEDNLWEGKNLTEGTYFYQFTVPDKNLERKGWILLKK